MHFICNFYVRHRVRDHTSFDEQFFSSKKYPQIEISIASWKLGYYPFSDDSDKVKDRYVQILLTTSETL